MDVPQRNGTERMRCDRGDLGGAGVDEREMFHSSTWNVPQCKLDVPRHPISRYLPRLAGVAQAMRHRFPCRRIACAGVKLLGVAWRRCGLVVGVALFSGSPGRRRRGAFAAPARHLGRVREKPGARVGVPGFVVDWSLSSVWRAVRLCARSGTARCRSLL
jgi:hypothetical protein